MFPTNSRNTVMWFSFSLAVFRCSDWPLCESLTTCRSHVDALQTIWRQASFPPPSIMSQGGGDLLAPRLPHPPLLLSQAFLLINAFYFGHLCFKSSWNRLLKQKVWWFWNLAFHVTVLVKLIFLFFLSLNSKQSQMHFWQNLKIVFLNYQSIHFGCLICKTLQAKLVNHSAHR